MIYDKNREHRACTLPKIFGLRRWFENRFGDICEIHDYGYVMRLGKWKTDMIFLKRMWERGYWWLAIPTFIMFNTVGFFYYYTK